MCDRNPMRLLLEVFKEERIKKLHSLKVKLNKMKKREEWIFIGKLFKEIKWGDEKKKKMQEEIKRHQQAIDDINGLYQ